MPRPHRPLLLPALLALILTPVAHAAEPSPSTRTIEIPTTETAVVLDGMIGEAEWAEAVSLDATGPAEVRAVIHEGYLYLALDAPPPAIAHVCLTRGERVAVLHASAALGTAVYERAESGEWTRVLDFEWCCRDGDETALAAQLAADGWIATTQRMGEGGQIEFRVDPDHELWSGPGPLRLAAVALGFETAALYTAPADLADDCGELTLVQGHSETTRRFDPETWMRVEP